MRNNVINKFMNFFRKFIYNINLFCLKGKTMKYNQAISNASWIVACKIAQSVLQLIVGMLCARYLGPANYGLINYAASIVAFALPLMRLGLNATMVHEFVETPEKEGEIIGTSLVLNISSSFLCIMGVSAFAAVANAGDKTAITVCVLYSFSLLFAAVEMIQYWYQYKLMAKYSSLIMFGAYLIVSVYKIYLLMTGKSVYWFALTNALDFGIIGISLIILYCIKGNSKFSFSLQRAKTMLSKSKHYILSSMMVVMFQSTDHIMLTSMAGVTENGYYTAAITCAGVFQFVYIAVVDSFRPLILSSKKENNADYSLNVSRLYGVIIYTALAQSFVFTLFAKYIVGVLYGADYESSIPILRILVWYLAFSYMGTVRNVWILAEQKQKYLWIINLSGAVFNIILNAILIPHWGACGAAFASLMTQVFANFVLGFIIKPIRENNSLLLAGLNPKLILSEGKNILYLLTEKIKSR